KQTARRLDLLNERRSWLGWGHPMAEDQRPGHHVAHEQPGQNNSWYHAGDEQPRDRLIRGGRIDDQDDRWRNEQSERAGAGERADRHTLVVAPLLQLWQGDTPHGGRRRSRRA